MLSDDDLTRLLGEAGDSFAVPQEGPGFVLEDLADAAPRHPHLRKRLVRGTAVAAAVAAGVLAVQAMGGDVSLTKQTSVAGGDATRSAAGTTGGSTGGTSGTTGSAYSPQTDTGSATKQLSRTTTSSGSSAAAAAPLAPSAATGSAATPKTPATVTDPFDDGARIVKTGTIALVVNDGKVGGVVVRVHAIASGAGGYVADEKSQEYGDDPTSTLTIRVPVAKYEAVTQQVRDQVKNGIGKIDSATSSGQDVTAQYADLQAQITSLTAARNRFLAILSRANTIGETLSVQQRVDSTQLQIDRLEGQRRSLAKQSELATLTVTVGEKAKAEAKTHVQSGLSKSWDNAKDGFTSGVESLISHSGRALLVLIVGALCLVGLRSSYRLARRRLV